MNTQASETDRNARTGLVTIFTGVVIGALLFALLDVIAGHLRPGPETDGITEWAGVITSVGGMAAAFGLLAAAATVVLVAVGRALGPALRRKDLTPFLLYAIAAWGFITINAHTFDGPAIRAHSRYTMIVWGFRLGGLAGIAVGILVLRMLIGAARTRPALAWTMSIVFGLGGAAALYLNVTQYPGLYPMLHTQLAAAAAVLVVCGPGLHLARMPRMKWIAFALVAVAVAGALTVRGRQMHLRIANAIVVRGPGVQEVGSVVVPIFDRFVQPPTLDLTGPPGGRLPENDADAEAEAAAWFQNHLRERLGDPRKTNILMIAMDTVRADHCRFNGYERETTPNLDELAKNAFVFRNAYAPYPTSNYSYSSFLTGLYPRATPVYGYIKKRNWTFGPDVPMAGLFARQGWRSICINAFNRNTATNDAWFGLLRAGFDVVNPDQREAQLNAKEIADSVIRTLDAESQRPFIMWTHFLDPHAPYVNWDGHHFGDENIDRYDSEIAWTDHQIGRIFDRLRERGELDKTIVVLFSDHGEEFFEHGGWDHNTSVYDEQVRVPLFISVPGSKGKRIDAPVSLVDVLPTLTSMIGVRDPERRHGRNLLPMMYGDSQDQGLAYCDHFEMIGGKDLNNKKAVIVGRKKLIHNVQKRSWELYDLEADPGEKKNLIGRDNDAFQHLGGYMTGLDSRIDGHHTGGRDATTDPADVYRKEIDGLVTDLLGDDDGVARKAYTDLNRNLLDYIGDLSPDAQMYLEEQGVRDLALRLRDAYGTAKKASRKTYIIKLLAEIRHPEVAPFLEELVRTNDRNAVIAALCLARMGNDTGRELLATAIDAPLTLDDRELAVGLANLGDMRGAPWVIPALLAPSWKIVGKMVQSMARLKVPHMGVLIRDYLTEGRWRPKPVQYALARSLGPRADDPDVRWMIMLLAGNASPTVRAAAAESLKAAGIDQAEVDAAREAVRLEWDGNLEVTNRIYDAAFESYKKSLAKTDYYNPGLRLRMARYMHLTGKTDEAREVLEHVVANAPNEHDKQIARRRLKMLEWPARVTDAGNFGVRISNFRIAPVIPPSVAVRIVCDLENTGSTALQGGFWQHFCNIQVRWQGEDGEIMDQRRIPDNFLPLGGVLPGEKIKLELIAVPADGREYKATPVLLFHQPWLNLDNPVIHTHDEAVEITPKTSRKKKKPGGETGRAKPESTGFEVVGSKPLPADAPTVTHPSPPVYVLESDGRPRLSSAGFVQLADEGPGFYYGALVQDRKAHSESVGIVGTNNWGDAESMSLAGRVVERWRAAHPDGPRLGIDEISAAPAGFPDYDGDGMSDHKTHQTGMNINFLLPCKVRPERYIHLGRGQNEALHDPLLFRELIDVLVDEGAFRLTTNVATRIIDDELPPTRHVWKEVARRPDGYSITYATGESTRLYVLTGKGDHGDHVNTMLWKKD